MKTKSTMYTETPGPDDRPEELPENERPEEMPQGGEQPQEIPEIEPGAQPDEVEPLVEPESPEIGQPMPGPGPDQGADQVLSILGVVEEDLVATHPRRTVGAWRQTLRTRDRHVRTRRVSASVA